MLFLQHITCTKKLSQLAPKYPDKQLHSYVLHLLTQFPLKQGKGFCKHSLTSVSQFFPVKPRCTVYRLDSKILAAPQSLRPHKKGQQALHVYSKVEHF